MTWDIPTCGARGLTSPQKTVQQLLQVKEMQKSDPHVVYDITGPFADLELEEFTSKLMPKRALDVGFKKYYCLGVSGLTLELHGSGPRWRVLPFYLVPENCLRHCTCNFGGDWLSNVQKWLEFLNHLLFVEWMSCLKACAWCSAAIFQKVMLPQLHLERIGWLIFRACLKSRFLSSRKEQRRKKEAWPIT